MLLFIKLYNKQKYPHNYNNMSKNDYSMKFLELFSVIYLNIPFIFRTNIINYYFKVYIYLDLTGAGSHSIYQKAFFYPYVYLALQIKYLTF